MKRRFSLPPIFGAVVLAGSLVVLAQDASSQGRRIDGESLAHRRTVAAASIDQMLESHWQAAGIVAAPQSSDEAFHRRAWLDLAGVAPPVAATRQFLVDTHKDKRGHLIDRLLRSPQYARHMATRWNSVLLPADALADLQQRASVNALHGWLGAQFYNNVPYDHLVGSFLTAGGAGDAGPAIFYTSHAAQPEKLAAATSRIFLGLQLQCAQCHDHPFDRWTQKDFWQYAAFFSQVEQRSLSPAGAALPGERMLIEDRPGREVRLPQTDQVVLPRYPGVIESPESDASDFRRRQLTIWLASRDNPYFARAAANRVWEHLFGRGLVDPVDRMDADNHPSHPELLNFLANYLVELRFDLREFYATLASTRAYGLSSVMPTSQRPDESSFAVMAIKTLTAEQYFDSLQQNVFCRSSGLSRGVTSLDPLRESFLARMRPTVSSPRDYPQGVVQALGLMNGPEVSVALSTNAQEDVYGLLTALRAPFFDDSQRIETLFLATLSRLPTSREAERIDSLLSQSADPSEAETVLADVLWVLLNTAECTMVP
jgi:hypothetical protein